MLHALTILAAFAQTTPEATNVPANATKAFAALEGNWQGQLEYRDYQSDMMQTIPLRVEFETIPDNTTFLQRSVFTDPDFPVLITTMISVEGKTATIANSRAGRPFESYAQTARLSASAVATSWTMTLTRIGRDDNRPAAIREVMIQDGNKLTVTKEVDFLDDGAAEWIFRNRLTLSAI